MTALSASPAVLRVRLSPALKRATESGTPAALLDATGPVACLGGSLGLDGLALPVTPNAESLFGPRGACLLGSNGPLWVSDTGHHRLLAWAAAPFIDDTPANWVIGQPDFLHEGRNAKGSPGPATFNVPTGITPCGKGLAVADAWNHRILIWHQSPRASNAPADLVLGQSDFSSMLANRGSNAPSASTLFWPYGIHWDGARLWVADSGNRRVLMWNGLPSSNGQDADLVLGQRDFNCRDENAGGAPCAFSMRWPHALAHWRGRLCVADAGNNRVMVWQHLPTGHGEPCNFILGQSHATLVDNNQSLYWPTAASLNMPYGIAAAGDWLLVTDTANSRLIGWHTDDCATGAAARALTAQSDFSAKGDNRWQMPVRDSLCWPYGIATCDDTVIISDSGNSRVVLWKLAMGCQS